MRIGIFTDAYKPYICGVTTSVEMLSKGLRELGHEVYIICLKPTNNSARITDDKYVVRVSGIPVYKKGMKDFRLSIFNRIKVRKLYEYNFDLVHIHTEFSIGKLGLLYAKIRNVPVIYTSHTMWEEYLCFVSNTLNKYAKKPLVFCLKKILKKYTRNSFYTIVPSQKTMNKLLEYGLISNYRIIPTGIDIYAFNENEDIISKTALLREKLGIKENEFCYLYLGRVSKEKNIKLLLETFLKIDKDNVVFIIVGKGVVIDELKDIVKKSNSKNRVIFTGEVVWEDVKYYYHLADCFLNASTSETQGLTYIEALASGLPIIVKNDEVVRSFVTDNNNGLIFRDEEQLMQKMNLIYSDIDLRKTLSKNAIKSVEKFSKECYTNNVLNLYETIII